VSKSNADLKSAEYAIPYLALAKLDPDRAKDKAAAALETVTTALAAATPESRGVLFYHRGLLLSVLGQNDAAAASLWDGVHATTGVLQYLNLDMLKTLAQ